MKAGFSSGIFILVLFTMSFCGNKQEPEPNQVSEYRPEVKETITYNIEETPLWQDNFDVPGKPDSNIWGYDIGGHGWGNSELQYYTDRQENAFVENGNLNIKAIKEDYKGSAYTSARLITKNKKDMLYGKVEVRAKLPKGVGTWPAVWMLATRQNYGSQYWPDNGELDIMEHVGFDQNRVHANIHTRAFHHSIGTNKGNNQLYTNVSEEYHVYAMVWVPNKITFYVDDKPLFEFVKSADYGWEQWPFDKPFHLLLNIAVGGSWGGQKGVDNSVYPQTLAIDYVKYYPLKKD